MQETICNEEIVINDNMSEFFQEVFKRLGDIQNDHKIVQRKLDALDRLIEDRFNYDQIQRHKKSFLS